MICEEEWKNGLVYHIQQAREWATDVRRKLQSADRGGDKLAEAFESRRAIFPTGESGAEGDCWDNFGGTPVSPEGLKTLL